MLTTALLARDLGADYRASSLWRAIEFKRADEDWCLQHQLIPTLCSDEELARYRYWRKDMKHTLRKRKPTSSITSSWFNGEVRFSAKTLQELPLFSPEAKYFHDDDFWTTFRSDQLHADRYLERISRFSVLVNDPIESTRLWHGYYATRNRLPPDELIESAFKNDTLEGLEFLSLFLCACREFGWTEYEVETTHRIIHKVARMSAISPFNFRPNDFAELLFRQLDIRINWKPGFDFISRFFSKVINDSVKADIAWILSDDFGNSQPEDEDARRILMWAEDYFQPNLAGSNSIIPELTVRKNIFDDHNIANDLISFLD